MTRLAAASSSACRRRSPARMRARLRARLAAAAWKRRPASAACADRRCRRLAAAPASARLRRCGRARRHDADPAGNRDRHRPVKFRLPARFGGFRTTCETQPADRVAGAGARIDAGHQPPRHIARANDQYPQPSSFHRFPRTTRPVSCPKSPSSPAATSSLRRR